MDFAHRYINIRRIIYVYKLVYKNINIYLQNGGRGYLSSELFNEDFISLVFK